MDRLPLGKTLKLSVLSSLLLPINYILFLVLLSLSIISCDGKQGVNTGQGCLTMEISPEIILGETRSIEVYFSVVEHVQRAILEDFQLRVTFAPSSTEGSKLIYTNAIGKQKIISSSTNNLTFFTSKRELSTEDENLMIPFTLIPAVGINVLQVKFELLDTDGNNIQTCNVSWIENVKNLNLNVTNKKLSELIIIKEVEKQKNNFLTPLDLERLINEGLAVIEDEAAIGTFQTKKRPTPVTKLSQQPTKKAKIKQKDNFLAPLDLERLINEGLAVIEDEAAIATFQTKKRPTPVTKLPQKPAKKAKIKEKEKKLEIITASYSLMDTSKLVELANINDTNAQEEIITRCLKVGNISLIQDLINPFKWQEIKEKAQQDERYVFLLLFFSYKAKGHPLFAAIFSSIEEHAKANDPLAQSNLGMLYYKGEGVIRNLDKSIEWLTKAANQEYALAQFNLGVMYHNGKGVERKLDKAMEWFTKGANQEYAPAQYTLGKIYYKGEGVECSLDKAIEWFTKAANQGHQEAQYALGRIYYNGEGVKPNLTKAIKLFIKAALQGHQGAQYTLGMMHYNGEGVAHNLDKAIRLFTKAANQGHQEAQYALGKIYYKGEGVEHNLDKAIEWFTKAANQGHQESQYTLGLMYYNGEGTERKLDKAIEWFTKAANQDHQESQYTLGLMYYNGEGTERKLDKAMEWFTKAANQGHQPAQVNLGNIYDNGLGVVRNPVQAIFWFMKGKSRAHLLNIFSLYPNFDSAHVTFLEEFNNIGKELSLSWQVRNIESEEYIYINKYMGSMCATFYMNAYRQLSQIMRGFINYQHILNNNPELMVDCIRFLPTRAADVHLIEKYKISTGETPYIKQHRFMNTTYLSFGKDNVELADKILHGINTSHFYNEVQTILKQLGKIFIQTRNQAIANGDNRLMNIFRSKEHEVCAQGEKFTSYCRLLQGMIIGGSAIRNQKFKMSHAYLFS
jgi:TPR repeat protein